MTSAPFWLKSERPAKPSTGFTWCVMMALAVLMQTMVLGSKPEMAFETGLRRHQVNFTNPLTSFALAGLTPTVTIRFVINTTTPVTCDLYLGQLALEIGEQQTQERGLKWGFGKPPRPAWPVLGQHRGLSGK